MFSEFLPFMKVSFVITNQAIIEAMEGEKIVHVIDLNASEPMQWCTLLHELSAQPQGPPHLRITGIHQQREVLDQTARSLTEEAEKLDIPFQFIPIVSKLENLDIEMLRVKTGEAVAISSVMQMHELLASGSSLKNIGESVEKDIVNSFSLGNNSACSHSTSPSRMDTFLTDLWALSPKVMVVTEQDSNHNSKNLMERLSESLYFYAALFDCLESTLPRTSLERTKMEKMLLGEEIKNIIACEGADRKHRHEKSGKWHQRFELAGFTKSPLSYYTLMKAKRLLQSFNCDGYKIKEENGCASIYWYDRPLFSISAWRSRR